MALKDACLAVWSSNVPASTIPQVLDLWQLETQTDHFTPGPSPLDGVSWSEASLKPQFSSWQMDSSLRISWMVLIYEPSLHTPSTS